jgi:hypothetical protein
MQTSIYENIPRFVHAIDAYFKGESPDTTWISQR